MATVTVIKNVTGTDEDKDSQYTFTATGLTEDADTFQLYGRQKTETVGGVETVTQENTKTYQDIPHGTEFSIVETENTDFITAITITRADGTNTTVTGSATASSGSESETAAAGGTGDGTTVNSDTGASTGTTSGTVPETSSVTNTGNITVDGDITITYTNTRNKQPVSIWKTDLEHNALTGAKFVLYKAEDYDDTANDGAGAPKEGAVAVVSETAVGNNGILSLDKLAIGEYRLVETQAPAGYISAESAIKIFIRPDAVTAMQLTGPSEVAQDKADNEFYEYWVEGQAEGTWQIRVWNNPGVSLPSTGGPGTNLLYLLGITLISLAGAGLVMKRRRREAA